MKSLIVDDDSTCSNVFKVYLEKYGKCDIASLGYDGFLAYKEAILNADPYDLIIIDIILPDINGYDVLQKIRTEECCQNISDYARTKIILTTSLDDEENRKIKKQLNSDLESFYIKSYGFEGFYEILLNLGVRF